MKKATKVKSYRSKNLLSKLVPSVIAIKETGGEIEGFPLNHYSYSCWSKFSTDQFMFKVNYINGIYLDTRNNVKGLLGSALHKAMQTYLGGNPDLSTPADEAEALKFGYLIGEQYLNDVSDSFIEYNKSSIKDRAQLMQRYSFGYYGYLKEWRSRPAITPTNETFIVEKKLKHKVQVDDKILPVPLVAVADYVYRNIKKRLIIEDHKFTSEWSDNDKIDPGKLIQAIFNYFTVYAETGEKPYSIIFREFKITENRDKSIPQTQEYELVYSEIPLAFELFYRFYEDITDALMGKQVYVPNIMAMYDREVSLLAYIYRLDVSEEAERLMKENKVNNITDFLKLKIQHTGKMKKYLEHLGDQFISGNSLNYKDMQIEERIKMKLGEHGIGVNFDSKVVGSAITLYRYDPSVGVKMKKLEQYVQDIEQVIGISGVRILAPIPDSTLIGFEVPNKDRTFPTSAPSVMGFNIPVGVSITGEPEFIDITEAPHVLIAGATGSGKSVFMTNLVKQVLSTTNTEVHLIDPKMVELAPFESQAVSYSHGEEKIGVILNDLVAEMNVRYGKLKGAGVRNIKEYIASGKRMKYSFVFIDEFADLVMTARAGNKGKKSTLSIEKELLKKKAKQNADIGFSSDRMLREFAEEQSKLTHEEAIIMLAQKGRACGIHIVMATQRPSVDVVSGIMKANFPTRFCFRTSTSTDSIVVLDEAGAEKLTGKGDMLYMSPHKSGLQRLQAYNL